MKTENVKVNIHGQVTHPIADAMIEAARKSLTAEGFKALMERTGNKPPTPAQLVTAAEEERHGLRI